MELTVILPALNEEKRIGAALGRLGEYLGAKGWDYEIIVVDDGCTDGTAAVVSQAAAADPRIRLISNGQNRGKGYSVKRAMLESSKALRLFTDADLPIPIEEIEKFIPLTEQGFGVLIGSRKVEGHESDTRTSPLRSMFSAVFNVIVQALVLRGIKDTQCGFKLFTARAAEEIFKRQRLDYFGFDVEILSIARLHGFKIKEVGIKLSNPKESSVNVFISPLKMFAEIIRLRLNLWKGIYR